MNKLLNFENISLPDVLSDDEWQAIVFAFANSRGDNGFTESEATDLLSECCAHLLIAQCIRECIDGKRAINLINGEISFSRMTTQETN